MVLLVEFFPGDLKGSQANEWKLLETSDEEFPQFCLSF